MFLRFCRVTVHALQPIASWVQYPCHCASFSWPRKHHRCVTSIGLTSISVTNVKTVKCMSILTGCCRQWCRPVHYGSNFYDLRNAGNWISLLDCQRAQHSGIMATIFALNFFYCLEHMELNWTEGWCYGNIPHLHHTPSWHGEGQLYFCIYFDIHFILQILYAAINSLKILVTARITRFNIQTLYVLPTQRINGIVLVLSANRNYLPVQH